MQAPAPRALFICMWMVLTAPTACSPLPDRGATGEAAATDGAVRADVIYPAGTRPGRPRSREDAALARGMSPVQIGWQFRPLAQAMQAMRAGNHDLAADLVLKESRVAAEIIEWHRLRAGEGSARDALAFLRRNPDWPGLPYLRRMSEPQLLEVPESVALAFFRDKPPQTAEGALALGRALIAARRSDDGYDALLAAWKSLPMTAELEDEYLDGFAGVLAPAHAERMDNMLWDGHTGDAVRLFGKVGGSQAVRLRIAYLQGDRDADSRTSGNPALRSDPGVAHARLEWLVRRGQDKAATSLILQASRTRSSLGGRSAQWSKRRLQMARSLIQAGEPHSAYQAAIHHYLDDGSDFASLEWLAGFVALRFLDRPEDALRHFTNMLGSVATPISLGRAHYWRGRAYEAQGRRRKAHAAYAEAARWQTGFYGLLAAERGGLRTASTLAGDENFPPWQKQAFARSSVFEAAMLMLAANEVRLAARFLAHLAENLDREAIGSLTAMLGDLPHPYLQVVVAKRAARYGMEIPGPYFAIHPLVLANWPVADELMLAIARRESEFDVTAVSWAGARGLMQLMPGTAREVAADLGIRHSTGQLTQDWQHNARLGGAYLAYLSEKFDGNVVLMAAGYNAGPHRAETWIEVNGDPRSKNVDIIDWIELIPFSETRNYVMRVAESLPVYRARLGKDVHPVPFSQELAGSYFLPLAQ